MIGQEDGPDLSDGSESLEGAAQAFSRSSAGSLAGLGLDRERFDHLVEGVPRLLILEELLYAACVRVSLRHPTRVAIKSGKLLPNTRGVPEEYDEVYRAVRRADAQLFATYGIDRDAAQRFLEAKRSVEVPQAFDPVNEECEFYYGCPTKTLNQIERIILKERGVIRFQRDHWKPSSLGGERLQFLCARHNHQKADLLIFQPDAAE